MARGFWGRATLGVALALYGWSMLGVELYLHGARVPAGPDRGLVLFRREVMGRAVLALGAATILAAAILALLDRERRGARLAALALVAAWIACAWALWPF